MDKTTQDRIENDAKAKFPIPVVFADQPDCMNKREGYIAGAAAENQKAQGLADALEQLKEGAPGHTIQFIDKAIQQWKGGNGKGEPVRKIEFMPIHPEDAQKFDCPTQIPMHLLDEGQAQRNHSQTLKRLKERGGLSVREILAIVGKKNWSYYSNLKWEEAIEMLNDILTNPK